MIFLIQIKIFKDPKASIRKNVWGSRNSVCQTGSFGTEINKMLINFK